VSHDPEALRQVYTARDDDHRLRQRYSLGQPGHLFLVQQRERGVLALLARHGLLGRLDQARVLDVGCGAGGLLLDLLRYGARPEHLAGVDLLPARLEQARARLPGADLRQTDAVALPYPDATFDLVCQMTLLSSVLDRAAGRQIAAEMRRVTRPDGLILWYDLRWPNPRNAAVRGIGRAELGRLFPDCAIEARSITLAAPLARLLAPRAWLLAELLERLPPLRTHLLAAVRPSAASSMASTSSASGR
jgi:SAM-dependent methyltransferase